MLTLSPHISHRIVTVPLSPYLTRRGSVLQGVGLFWRTCNPKLLYLLVKRQCTEALQSTEDEGTVCCTEFQQDIDRI